MNTRTGIVLHADPQLGIIFQQEFAPGVAEDETEMTALGETIDIPAGTFSDTLDDTTDLKDYINGIGLAIDEFAELILF